MAARFLTLRGTGEKIQEKGLISHQKFTFKSTRHLHAGGRISTQYFLYTIPNKDSETVRYQKWARKKWADMFCVLWLEQGIFVCNTFKKFVQYKIGFMGFFFFCHHNRMARLEEWKTWTLGFVSRSEDWVTVRTSNGFTKAMVHMLTVGTRVGEALSTASTRVRLFAGVQALMFSHVVLVFKCFPTNIAGVFTRT